MKLLDIFKKKEVKKKKTAKVEKKETPKKEIIKEEKEIKTKAVSKEKRLPQQAFRILYSPHVTEKATILSEENKYVFKVWPKANKIEIRKAVQEVYGVDVVGVKVINIHEKRRKRGRQSGWKKGYKKAIIEIKEGQKIEILPR